MPVHSHPYHLCYVRCHRPHTQPPPAGDHDTRSETMTVPMASPSLTTAKPLALCGCLEGCTLPIDIEQHTWTLIHEYLAYIHTFKPVPPRPPYAPLTHSFCVCLERTEHTQRTEAHKGCCRTSHHILPLVVNHAVASFLPRIVQTVDQLPSERAYPPFLAGGAAQSDLDHALQAWPLETGHDPTDLAIWICCDGAFACAGQHDHHGCGSAGESGNGSDHLCGAAASSPSRCHRRESCCGCGCGLEDGYQVMVSLQHHPHVSFFCLSSVQGA